MKTLQKFKFRGNLKLTKSPFEIDVEALDRESAIAYVELTYPNFNWRETISQDQ